jgi:hypothetical protein
VSHGYDLTNKFGYRLMQARLGVYDKYISEDTVLSRGAFGIQN